MMWSSNQTRSIYILPLALFLSLQNKIFSRLIIQRVYSKIFQIRNNQNPDSIYYDGWGQLLFFFFPSLSFSPYPNSNPSRSLYVLFCLTFRFQFSLWSVTFAEKGRNGYQTRRREEARRRRGCEKGRWWRHHHRRHEAWYALRRLREENQTALKTLQRYDPLKFKFWNWFSRSSSFGIKTLTRILWSSI